MKILMLTPYLPYPPSSGGQIRTINLLKYLSKKNQITLISLIKNPGEKKYLDELEPYCSKIYACKRAEKPWQVKNVLRAVFSAQPFLVVRNYSSEAKTVIEKLLSEESFDVIHAETFYIMPHIPQTKIPVLLVEQTIEYMVYQHFVDLLPFFLRPIFNLDIKKLIYWERYYWRKASLVATMSRSDKEKIRKLENSINLEIIPNGAGDDMMDIPLIKRDYKKPKLLFIGNFYWLQNLEAATFLVKHIFPLIKNEVDLELIIAGQNASSKLKNLVEDGVEIIDIETNDIKTVKRLYQDSTLFVSPIYGPGGTRLKLLAAMAAGLPIISTKTGIEGLDLKKNIDVILAENEKQFAKKIQSILLNKRLYEKIQRNAYKLVREKYNWEKIAEKLETVYRQLTQK